MTKQECYVCHVESDELDFNEFTGEMECGRCFFGFAYIPNNFFDDLDGVIK